MRAYGLKNPLIKVFPSPKTLLSVPGNNDFGEEVGQVVIYRVSNTAVNFYAYGGKNSSGNAIWTLLGVGTGDLETLSGDTGTATPSAGDIVVAGGTNVTTVASGATVTVNLDGAIVLTGLTVNGNLTQDTGNVDIGTDNAVGTIDIGGGTSIKTMTILADAAAHTLAVGSASAGAMTIDTGAGISIDGATASNFTVTGAAVDLTLSSVGGSVNISSTEAIADSIVIDSVNGGIGIDSVTASHFTVTGVAEDLTLSSVGGSIDILSNEVVQDAILINSTAGGIDIIAQGDVGLNLNMQCIDRAVNILAGLAAADAILIDATVGGVTISGPVDGVTVDGDLKITTNGTQLQVAGGAVTDFVGSAVLVAGTVTVANTNIASNDLIIYSRSTTGGTEGTLSYTISAATSFTITSSNGADTSTIAYFIVRQT